MTETTMEPTALERAAAVTAETARGSRRSRLSVTR